MSRPSILMIDELSLGLAPTVVSQLLDVVRAVHARGTTVLIVEQSVNVALELAERAVFMEKGQIRFEGRTEELLSRPDLLRSVFIAGTGEVAAPTHRHVSAVAETDAPALDVRGVAKHYGGIRAVDDVDFELKRGEILGVIGHNGAGKTTLMDCISGFTEIDAGVIRLNGDDVTADAPRNRAVAGLGRSFQEARLFPTLTVDETLAVACERHLWNRSMLADGLQLPASIESEDEVHAVVDELVELMGLTPYRGKLIGELSTGTRRVVDLACILAQEPSVLLLDEPSSGVAQRETEALVDLLERVRQRTGCAMLVIEHDMPLLRAICDRMVALELGRVIATGTPEEVLSHPQVIESYLGTNAATISRSGTRRPAKKKAAAKKPGVKKAVASKNGAAKRGVSKRVRDDVVDDYHGTLVPDPYRWMEDQDNPDLKEWLVAQDELCQPWLAALEGRDAWRKTQARLLPGTVSAPAVRGDRFFFTRREPDEQHAVFLMNENDGADRVLFDPMEVDPSGLTTLDVASVSPDGTLVVIGTSSGGDEDTAISVMRVDDLAIIDGPIDRTRYTSVGWLEDSSGFFYVRRLTPEPFNRRVFRHVIGAPIDDDELIFGEGRDPSTYYGLDVSTGGRWLLVSASIGTEPRNDLYIADLDGDGAAADGDRRGRRSRPTATRARRSPLDAHDARRAQGSVRRGRSDPIPVSRTGPTLSPRIPRRCSKPR